MKANFKSSKLRFLTLSLFPMFLVPNFVRLHWTYADIYKLIFRKIVRKLTEKHKALFFLI